MAPDQHKSILYLLVTALVGGLIGAGAIKFFSSSGNPTDVSIQVHPASTNAELPGTAGRTNGISTPGTYVATASATSQGGEVKGFDEAVPAAVPKTSLTNPAPFIPPYRQVFVMAVEVNEVPGFEKLQFAENDAQAVSSVFRNKFGFTNVTTLTGTNATRARVFDKIREITTRISPDDDFIFFFSGHGLTVPEGVVTNGVTNIVARHGYLAAYAPDFRPDSARSVLDEKALAMKPLVDALRALPARHRVMFLDSCFSGLAFVRQALAEARPPELYREVIMRPTVQVVTAGLDTETARENPLEGQGVFTSALLHQLQSSDVLTMEEVFFPLRVSVRKQTEAIGAPMSMTPQHRYLLYDKGTFVFVPTDRLTSWADTMPRHESLADATKKGYFRPVEISEVTNVVSLAASKEKLDAEIDRYEARAAMGDPLAAKALAEIYGRGLGGQSNARRAKLFGGEANDYLLASGQLNWARFMGINDPASAFVVNALLGDSPVSIGGGTGIPFANGNVGNAAGMAMFGLEMAKIFGGGGGAGGLEGKRNDVVRLINERKYKEASRELTELERRLTELSSKLPNPPPQISTIRERLAFARKRIEVNAKDSAMTALNQAGTQISELMQLLPQTQKP